MNEICANCGREKEQHHMITGGPFNGARPCDMEHWYEPAIVISVEFIEAVRKLKRGSCWCGVGIGNPMCDHHSTACQRITAMLDQISKE